jgi:hypothetical protein
MKHAAGQVSRHVRQLHSAATLQMSVMIRNAVYETEIHADLHQVAAEVHVNLLYMVENVNVFLQDQHVQSIETAVQVHVERLVFVL